MSAPQAQLHNDASPTASIGVHLSTRTRGICLEGSMFLLTHCIRGVSTHPHGNGSQEQVAWAS